MLKSPLMLTTVQPGTLLLMISETEDLDSQIHSAMGSNPDFQGASSSDSIASSARDQMQGLSRASSIQERLTYTHAMNWQYASQ